MTVAARSSTPATEGLMPLARAYSDLEPLVLHYAAVFFVIAIVAALFGLSGIAAGAAEIGKILFLVFTIFAVIALIASVTHGK